MQFAGYNDKHDVNNDGCNDKSDEDEFGWNRMSGKFHDISVISEGNKMWVRAEGQNWGEAKIVSILKDEEKIEFKWDNKSYPEPFFLT